jgi:hypothetical protein
LQKDEEDQARRCVLFTAKDDFTMAEMFVKEQKKKEKA